MTPQSSGGGDKTATLPGAHPGYIYWWDSATDHVGLYYTAQKVIHAPGVGKKVVIIAAADVKAPNHTELMYVNTKSGGVDWMTLSKRQAARDWAKGKEGKPYKSNFAFNKKINDTKYNCSQLVWAAWKATAGVDLDNGPGKGVYPGDIREDDRTHVYKKSI